MTHRLAMLLFLLGACGQASSVTDGLAPQTSEDELKSARVQCHPPHTVAYPRGQLLVRATVSDSDDKTATWSMTDGSIDGDGIFTAPAKTGSVTITATAGNGTTSSCTIDVVRHPAKDDGPVHTALGLPDSLDDDEHLVLEKDLYTVSYNQKLKTPNWVAWELNGTYLGGAQRPGTSWKVDTTLPDDMPKATLDDYASSGYDRGHMCPSADRSRVLTDLRSTFVLTNALPQLSALNSGPWQDLEGELQAMAFAGKEIFVVAGGLFDAHPDTIGNGVAVPHSTWKVAIIMDRLSDRADDVTTSTQVIAVMMPNDASVQRSDPWHQYAVSVDDIEQVTGLDFLSLVDTDVQAVIER